MGEPQHPELCVGGCIGLGTSQRHFTAPAWSHHGGQARTHSCVLAVLQDTDIVTLEFTYNDERDGGYTKPSRQAFEQLLRKLLRLPSRCCVPRSCGCVVARSMAGLASLLGLAPATNPLPTTWNACCMPTLSPCNPCLW